MKLLSIYTIYVCLEAHSVPYRGVPTGITACPTKICICRSEWLNAYIDVAGEQRVKLIN